ncbi:MAG: sialidase family protein, partial [Bacteroidota bacterium]
MQNPIRSAAFVLTAAIAFLLLNIQFSPPLSTQDSSFPKIPKKDRVDLAIAHEVAITKDLQSGEVPRERLLAAIDYANEKRRRNSTRAGIVGITWDERGPDNVGGRTRSVLVDANDPTGNTVWAASVGGGLWKTATITSNPPAWAPINDLFDNIAVTAIAQDPSNSQIMYFGTGEGWFNADAIRGFGIWKSTNGGTNWVQLGSTTGNAFRYVQKLVVDGSGIVFAVCRNGGIRRSTDGGTTWTEVLGNGNGAGTDRAADLEIAANGDMYATIGVFNTDGIYKSTDGGINWTQLGGGLPANGYERIEIACAPSDANRLYALFQDNASNECNAIYRSDNAGGTWTTVSLPAALGMTVFSRNQAWYDLICAVDPVDEDRVFIGGIDILLSEDGGNNWNQISQWYGGGGFQYVHADQHAMA